MSAYFSQAAVFLVETVFGIYILMVLLRFLFQLVRADFYNPFSQFLVRLTNPPLLPLRRIIPGLGGIDVASIILLLALQVLKLLFIVLIHGYTATPIGMVVLSFAQLLELTVWVFLVTIFVRIILSWLAPYADHPVTGLLISLTEPLMRPARRLLPPISGLD
ncbi:MAG TPA: YggT family protein, partial [Acidiferrobacterales bacterium]|nr:YggT family protein [Acidiferrobacterales bacterium]